MLKAIIASILVLIVSLSVIQVHPAFALKNLFKCITDASAGGTLSFKDYVNCYNVEFHGQLNNQPATMSDSVTP